MNDETRKLLTEFLGECWHDSAYTDHRGNICLKCDGATFLGNQRTFATPDDMMVLKNKLVERGELGKFISYIQREVCARPFHDEVFAEWLNRYILEPTRFCELVGEFTMSTKSKNVEII